MSSRKITGSARVRIALLLLAGSLFSQCAWSFQNRVYLVPLPEDDLLQSMRDIASSSTPKSPVTSVTSLTVATGGTLVYWDHWEDGTYDPDIFNPTNVYSGNSNPQGTQIWGDRNLGNGCPPIKTGAVNPCNDPEDDFLEAGDVVFMRNEVRIRGSNGGYYRRASDDCELWPSGTTLVDHCFDGRDKIGATFPLVVSRAAWPNGAGSLLAGAVEVADTRNFVTAGGTAEAPVGPDTQNGNSMFQYSALYIMAGEDNTSVFVNRPGQSDPTYNLNQGEYRLVKYNQESTRVEVTAGSAQVHLITGDINSRYETRWYLLPPTADWGTEYITPVGTNTSDSTCTRLYLYNPGSGTLPVAYSDGGGNTQTVSVPGNSARRSRRIPAGAAARVSAASPFYALSVTDCVGGELYDWGHPLVAVPNLTTQFLTGWAPGCTTSNCGSSGSGNNDDSRSPVWVTPASGTGVDIYVDFDGEGAVCVASDFVVGKALKLTLDEGEHARIVDDPPADSATGSQGDYDMTGARIFTCDGTEVSVVWGQDPALSGSNDNEALDLGTAVPPLGSKLRCSIEADKTIISSPNGNPRVNYIFRVFNDGELEIGSDLAQEPQASVDLANVFTSGTVADTTPPNPGGTFPPLCARPEYKRGDVDGNNKLRQDEIWEYECAVNVVPTPAGGPPFLPVINAAAAVSLEPVLESLACQWVVNVVQGEFDFGDTPSSYGSPSHFLVNAPDFLRLGMTDPDSDPGLQNANNTQTDALGDDNDVADVPVGNVGGDDEDGVTFRALPNSGGILSTVVVSNASGSDAKLCAWVDGSGPGLANGVVDGRFEDQEGQCVTVPVNGSNNPPPECKVSGSGYSCELLWTFNTGTSVIDTYARFRLTTGIILDLDLDLADMDTGDGGFGPGIDGEVEDYALSIWPTRATIVAFRVEVVPAEGLDLTDPATGEPRVDPRTGQPLEVPPGGVAQVQWQTLSEQGTLGFYLERRDDSSGRWERVDDDLLPGLIDAPLGGEYRLFDLDVAAGEKHHYRLREVEAWGNERLYGPYEVVVGADHDGSRRARARARGRLPAAGRRSQAPNDRMEVEWGAWHQLDRGFQGRKRLPPRLRGNRLEPDADRSDRVRFRRTKPMEGRP